jgi:hypothetical protein
METKRMQPCMRVNSRKQRVRVNVDSEDADGCMCGNLVRGSSKCVCIGEGTVVCALLAWWRTQHLRPGYPAAAAAVAAAAAAAVHAHV